MDDLRLLSPKRDHVKLKALKAGAACTLFDDANPCSIEVYSQKNIESSRAGNGANLCSIEVMSRKKKTESLRGVSELNCVDVEEVAPLRERVKTKKQQSVEVHLTETEKHITGHTSTVSNEAPCSSKQQKVKTKDDTKGTKAKLKHDAGSEKRSKQPGAKLKSTATDTILTTCTKYQLPSEAVQPYDKEISQRNEISKTIEIGNKQIVIDSSSDSEEEEDPLKKSTNMNRKDKGKSHVLTSSLHHESSEVVTSSLHHDSSSDAESLSDDDLPPLANRIGSKRPGKATSPIKTKVSPLKDLMLASKSTRKGCGRKLEKELLKVCDDTLKSKYSGEADNACSVGCRRKLDNGLLCESQTAHASPSDCSGETENTQTKPRNRAVGSDKMTSEQVSSSNDVIVICCSRDHGKISNKQSTSSKRLIPNASCIGSAESPIEID